ncbi:class I SAM-dependent methyltransferase [Evansella tamaricis]|uniref:Class I SAM-dependent methyltransferase n=1 Tax=Evansella tamaricis TaxID=2069301 RepID=A0ABS6JI49_9BACI|nr:class I SAM-dependent methyltransferase [Evansella tamaricis]MBU9713359.1 class I SAM-dependent methyltransferase [Evansella tamaricis]
MLEYTGERVIPEKMNPMNGMLLEHIARYYFAEPFVSGRVLDIACGSGYGSKMLAKARKKEISGLTAADISHDAIDYAIKNYYHPLLTYRQGDIMNPKLKDEIGTFDTIVSFETIEHVEDDITFMERITALLNPGGTLILSTPFGQGRGKPSKEPFHYHQLTVQEFKELFLSFETVEFYFQRGVMFEHPRKDRYYPIGIAVAKKET